MAENDINLAFFAKRIAHCEEQLSVASHNADLKSWEWWEREKSNYEKARELYVGRIQSAAK